MEKEERLRSALSQIESYRELSRLLQQQMAELVALRSELSMTLNFLREMEKMKEGDQILAPIGSGSFIKAKIESTNVALIGIGADIVVERTPKEAQQMLENRMKEIDNTLKTLRESLEKVSEKIRSLAPEIEKLIQESRGEV